jgi:hypothetical protein
MHSASAESVSSRSPEGGPTSLLGRVKLALKRSLNHAWVEVCPLARGSIAPSAKGCGRNMATLSRVVQPSVCRMGYGLSVTQGRIG